MSNDAVLTPFNAVAVVGSVTIDRNELADRTLLKAGGAATYAGLTYRRHSVPTVIVCNVAPAEEAILALLRRQGIQVNSGRTGHTTRFVNREQPGGRTQSAPALAASIGWGQVAAVCDRVACLHLGPLHPGDIDPQVFSGLQRSNALIVLDAQGLTRRIDRGRIAAAGSEHLAAALRAADIVKADEAELEVVRAACGADIEALMERYDIAEWIVTRGPRGGSIHVRGGRDHHYEPVGVGPPVDPTGAGDVFLAAYTVARFRLLQPPAAAARHAARISAEQVAGRYIDAALLDAARLGIADDTRFSCSRQD
jgi:sugar/nucleoside kinase (ribokinase family)